MAKERKEGPFGGLEQPKGTVDASVQMLSEMPEEGAAPEPTAEAEPPEPAREAREQTKVYHGETKPVVAVLIPLAGPASGRVFALARGETVLGSAEDCTVRIESEFISPRQLMIQHDAGRFAMMPLRGPNPVLVNGHVLEEPARLRDGDVITIADTALSFRTAVPPEPE